VKQITSIRNLARSCVFVRIKIVRNEPVRILSFIKMIYDYLWQIRFG
jgi:hypothetical protein